MFLFKSEPSQKGPLRSAARNVASPIAEFEDFLEVGPPLVDAVDDVLVDPVQDERHHAHHRGLQHRGISLLPSHHLQQQQQKWMRGLRYVLETSTSVPSVILRGRIYCKFQHLI